MNDISIDVTVVVPAFNEADRLPRTLDDIVRFAAIDARRFEIIVVDDGSVDATSAMVAGVAQRHPEVRLIRLPRNRGKGHAVRTGVVNAMGDRVLFADADGATPIAELYRLERALDDGADVAIGSRALESEDVRGEARLLRRMSGRIFHMLVRYLTVQGIVDTQCGFKLFTRAAAVDLFSRMRMDGFAFDVELLMMAQRRAYHIAEIPVNWTHQPGSKVSVVLDGLRMARDLFHIRANAMRGLYETPHLAPNFVPATPMIGGWEPRPITHAGR